MQQRYNYIVSLNASIDTGNFTTKSTKLASSSKATLDGFSASETFRMGKWSRNSTWQKYYHNFIIGNEFSYQLSIVVQK